MLPEEILFSSTPTSIPAPIPIPPPAGRSKWPMTVGLILLGLVLLAAGFFLGSQYRQRHLANSSTCGTAAEEVPAIPEKIIASEITPQGCRIKIKTNKREIFVDTNYSLFGMGAKCYQSVLNSVSPSGRYVAFQDISGGVDSMIRVYTLEFNDTLRLDVFGTSTIFDLMFLPDDQLIVLGGYKGSFGEQYLRAYDVAGLFKTYLINVDQQYKIFKDLSQYVKTTKLPDVGQDYARLSDSIDKLKIHGSGGLNTPALQEYNLEDILSNVLGSAK